jgi:predicted RNase H-like HicB family nuclease
MIKYEVVIYWSDEDQAFLAEAPEIPGCMADGKTYQEALSNMVSTLQFMNQKKRSPNQESAFLIHLQMYNFI